MIKHNRSKPLFQPFPFALSTIIDIIVMLIDIDNNGTYTVNTIKDSNIRIQADYNILSKYLKGCFKEIPWENINIDCSKHFCHCYTIYNISTIM